MGHFHYATDGFEDNSDSRREVFNAFVQADLNSRASVQAEARSADAARGITFFANDPTYSFPIRFNEHLSNYRVGARVELSIESELLASFSHMRKFATTPPVGFDPDTAFISKWDVSELQYVWDASVFNLISGGTRFLGKTRSTDGTVDQRLEHTLVYAYAQPQIPTANLALTLAGC
ncbi:hypothetical protein FJY94_08555 [Candidatus Kaiserbacteria bacterium]|nr:hypothetical protein [Candidatus Kaiserbacteria bacterium]